MSQLILDFPLAEEDVILYAGQIRVELGNGVRLTTTAPEWLQAIKSGRLQLIMEVDGVPPGSQSDATDKSPVQ